MRSRFLALALSFAVAAPTVATSAAAQDVTEAMHQDVSTVQQKLIALAKAIPESAYDWRPGEGVRSIGEVFLHVASDNYLIPVAMGKAAPASTGITSDYNTAMTYEKRDLGKDAIVAELEASFKHLHEALALTTPANLHSSMRFFGQDMTRWQAMVGTVTHLHEHLGQAIAYARSNDVVPPWSK